MIQCNNRIWFWIDWKGMGASKRPHQGAAALHFRCELGEGHPGNHKIRGRNADTQRFVLEWKDSEKKGKYDIK